MSMMYDNGHTFLHRLSPTTNWLVH